VPGSRPLRLFEKKKGGGAAGGERKGGGDRTLFMSEQQREKTWAVYPRGRCLLLEPERKRGGWGGGGKRIRHIPYGVGKKKERNLFGMQEKLGGGGGGGGFGFLKGGRRTLFVHEEKEKATAHS